MSGQTGVPRAHYFSKEPKESLLVRFSTAARKYWFIYLLAIPGLRRKRRLGTAQMADAASPSPAVPAPEGGLTGFGYRLSALTALKFRAMAGGWRGLAALICVCLLCGLAALVGRTPKKQDSGKDVTER